MAELIMAHLAEVCLLLKKELFSAHAGRTPGCSFGALKSLHFWHMTIIFKRKLERSRVFLWVREHWRSSLSLGKAVGLHQELLLCSWARFL